MASGFRQQAKTALEKVKETPAVAQTALQKVLAYSRSLIQGGVDMTKTLAVNGREAALWAGTQMANAYTTTVQNLSQLAEAERQILGVEMSRGKATARDISQAASQAVSKSLESVRNAYYVISEYYKGLAGFMNREDVRQMLRTLRDVAVVVVTLANTSSQDIFDLFVSGEGSSDTSEKEPAQKKGKVVQGKTGGRWGGVSLKLQDLYNRGYYKLAKMVGAPDPIPDAPLALTVGGYD